MVDFHPAAVRFGKPGKLLVAALTAAEPAAVNDAWPSGWTPLGYTAEGSTFHYNINTDNVDVAEELDILHRVTTGRDASVEVALAEMTHRNLMIAFNGGIVVADGNAWEFEPPDLGAETRIKIGWDAIGTTADNDLRFVFRQCLQGGNLSMQNRKGSAKQTMAVTFHLEKPDTGLKILKIWGSGVLNPV